MLRGKERHAAPVEPSLDSGRDRRRGPRGLAGVQPERRPPTGGGPNLDFTLKDVNGADVHLADFKGRPMLLNFWATWCTPCKAEIPWFVEFAETYEPQHLAVIGVSVDDAPAEIKGFAETYKINYPLLVGRDHQDVAKAFGAQEFIPVSWLIRPDGSVQSQVTGIHEKQWFQQQIEAMLPGATATGD